MNFNYTIRKLKQLHSKETLLVPHHDRFAPARVTQLEWAIAILQASEIEKPVFKNIPELLPYKPRYKKILHG